MGSNYGLTFDNWQNHDKMLRASYSDSLISQWFLYGWQSNMTCSPLCMSVSVPVQAGKWTYKNPRTCQTRKTWHKLKNCFMCGKIVSQFVIGSLKTWSCALLQQRLSCSCGLFENLLLQWKTPERSRAWQANASLYNIQTILRFVVLIWHLCCSQLLQCMFSHLQCYKPAFPNRLEKNYFHLWDLTSSLTYSTTHFFSNLTHSSVYNGQNLKI